MPKFAVSNIALPAFAHEAELGHLAALGLAGIEIAPTRVWREGAHDLTPRQISGYRALVEKADLRVVGLHSLLFNRPDLNLFGAPSQRAALLDFFVLLSGLCRDLGGRTLIWGGGRRRGPVSRKIAEQIMIEFMDELCHRIESHGTVFCLEPLGPQDSDFINSALESLAVVNTVDHPALAVQLDAKALVENGEAVMPTFLAVKDRLVHFHANQPSLNVLDQGLVNHRQMGDFLQKIGYDGYVSIEQRLLNEADPLSDIRRSAAVLKDCYT